VLQCLLQCVLGIRALQVFCVAVCVAVCVAGCVAVSVAVCVGDTRTPGETFETPFV